VNPFSNYDKRTIYAISGGVALALFIGLVIIPLISRSSDLDGKLEKSRKNLTEIIALAEKYQSLLMSSPQGLRNQRSNEPLSVIVEKSARKAGIGENISKMTPKLAGGKNREEEILVSFSSVSLTPLVEFLKDIQISPAGISVQKGVISTSFENEERLDANLTIVKVF